MGHIAYVIPDDLHTRAKIAAARKGQTLRAWIEDALREAADRQDAEHERERRRTR